MATIGQMIADSGRLGLGYAKRLLEGVTADQFARFASPGGQTIVSNHPAFIYGHLSLYAPRIVEGLGGDTSAITATDTFVQLFDMNVECQDDPDGTVYPSMEEVTGRLFTGYAAAVEALSAADDSALMQPNPGPMSDRFGTVGSMFAFYVGGHFMIHMGQMSAWRRAVGLGPA